MKHALFGLLKRSLDDKGVFLAALLASVAVHVSAVGFAQRHGRIAHTAAMPLPEVELFELPIEVTEPPAPTLPPPVVAPERPRPRGPKPVAAPQPAPVTAAPEPAPTPAAPEPAPVAGPVLAASSATGAGGCAGGVCLPVGVGQGGTGKVGASGSSAGTGTARAASGSSAEAVPLVRVKPAYPQRAADQEIEGWVLVRFTIAADGAVHAPEVIDASPKRIFDRAALDAISRWKYRPTLDNGRAVPRPGVSVKLMFKLE